jgi:hypothetical protein
MKSKGLFGMLLISLLATSATGCDALDDIFDPGEEINGTLQSKDVQASTLTLTDGTVYVVNGDTEFEGVTGLGDAALAPGVEVEIEYEDKNGQRVALEVELADSD